MKNLRQFVIGIAGNWRKIKNREFLLNGPDVHQFILTSSVAHLINLCQKTISQNIINIFF